MVSSNPTEDVKGNGYGSIDVVHLDVEDRQAEPSFFLKGRKIRINPTFGAIAFFVVLTAFAGFHKYGGANLLSSTAQLVPSEVTLSSDKEATKGAIPHYYRDQLVDHFDSKNKNTWSQRYYTSDKYFAGPGHPIFLVIGGEDDLEVLLYPFVNDHLAKKFKAYILEPEHRFYGESQPIKVKKSTDLIGLLTVEQAMEDILQLLAHTRKKLGCSQDQSSKHYCPVITVGGSYPGFMSALLRIVHPDKIDIAYASSAPLKLYSQEMVPHDYFELVTRTAEQASAGCSSTVRDTLEEVHASILASASFLDEARSMNICLDNIPDYINSKEIFAQEVMMIVGENFADFNMENYPPTADQSLAKACFIFQDDSLDNYEKMDNVFQLISASNGVECKECGFDLVTQLPWGKNARISTADWTGSGDGMNGLSWEFQMCTELVVQTGFSEKSMFYPRDFTVEWLTQYCQSRFGVEPMPHYLVDKFHFDDLSSSSRILFTNGMNDGWSVGSILDDEGLAPSIAVLNFPNGAHHSDLQHGSNENDTDDIIRGYRQITDQIGVWLEEIKEESQF
jgi:hypothetical protein